MKCESNESEETFMSVERYSQKFKILALVVNTASLINERTTPTLSISHSVLAPVTLISTYIFLGVLAIGALKRKYASEFMEIYSLICCASLQISLSLMVFNYLKTGMGPTITTNRGTVLNAVLPMFTIILILADLILILFSSREEVSNPMAAESSQHILFTLPSWGISRVPQSPLQTERQIELQTVPLAASEIEPRTETQTEPRNTLQSELRPGSQSELRLESQSERRTQFQSEQPRTESQSEQPRTESQSESEQPQTTESQSEQPQTESQSEPQTELRTERQSESELRRGQQKKPRK